MAESDYWPYKEMPRCQRCGQTAFELFDGICWECDDVIDQEADQRAETDDADYMRDTAAAFHEAEWEEHKIRLVDFGGRDPSEGG